MLLSRVSEMAIADVFADKSFSVGRKTCTWCSSHTGKQ